jgi:aminomethyltransferase
VSKKKVCLKINGKGIPREGQTITDEGKEIGVLTSGTFSTTLKNGIGMGYVSTEFLAEKKTEFMVNIRGKEVPASIVKPPFVETKYYRGL